MYEVFIVACLIARPAECQTFEVWPERYADLQHCSQAAPRTATQWGLHRTNWRIKKWTCAQKAEMI